MTTWEAAFARAFGLTTAEFYDYFYERRRDLFTQFHGRVQFDADALPSGGFVVATAIDQIVDRLPLVHVAAVADDGAFTLNLPKGQAHTLALADGATDCRLPVSVAGEAAWTRTPLKLKSNLDMVAGIDLALPPLFCDLTVTLRLPEGQAADAVRHNLVVSICKADGAGCVKARPAGREAYIASIPLPGEYVISLDQQGRSCPLYLSDDGLVADLDSARRYPLETGSQTVTVSAEQLGGLCNLVVKGQLLGRSADWNDSHAVTLYRLPDELGPAFSYSARIRSDGTFVASVPEAGKHRLTITVRRPKLGVAGACHITSDNVEQWQERETSTAVERGYLHVGPEAPVTLTWRIDPGACRWLIEGRVTDSDLNPHANLTFDLCQGTDGRGPCVGPTTSESGRFSVVAPTAGPQTLVFPHWRRSDCAAGSNPALQRQLSVSSADVKDVHWVLPSDPCAP